MKRQLDLDNWARKAHFEFFRVFEEPFYGVCVNVDCTAAYRFTKDRGVSVFLYLLHKSLTAAHIVEPFRYRIEQDQVVVYDRIDASSTIARENGTFGFGHILYRADLTEFLAGAQVEVERVRAGSDLTRNVVENVIRYSALPWINFTALSHATRFSRADSCPRISFGKIMETAGQRGMPLSIHVHHALIDGLQVGQYIDCFQELLEHP